MTYERSINRILDDVYREWTGNGTFSDYQALADRAGLHYSTVYRVMTRETKCPLFRTVWKLARAVGMELQLVSVQRLKKAS